MRIHNSNPVWSFALGAALGGVLLAVLWGTSRITAWAGEQILRGSAQTTALNWLHTAGSGPSLDRIMSGEGSLDPDPLTFALAHGASGIVKIRLLDRQGRVRIGDKPGAAPNPLFQAALRTETAQIELSSPSESRRLARAYLPVRVNGSIGAVAELEIDQSEQWQLIAATLWASSIAVTGLAGFGCGVPLLALLRQARRRQAADERARYLAEHDPMTHLLNRSCFVEALEAVLAVRAEPVALLCIDLIGLREINDRLGHDSGDEALVHVARVLRQASGRSALVARFGGDSFAIALPGATAAADVKGFAASLLHAIEAPQRLKGHEVSLSAKLGIAQAPGDGEDALRLLRAADLALDRARLRPNSCSVFFERTIEAELQRRRELEQQIRQALTRGTFELYFQPLFETATTRLSGFEALLRMPDGAGGFVSPAIFIPVAEEMGLIVEIGQWVLKRACALAVHWPDHLTVGVNLSPAQFKAGAVNRIVQESLAAAGLPAHRLELEITEGLVLHDDAAVMRELAELKSLGVSIVMDDFGTGYSSLSYLWKFPFDKIKIDRSFMLAFGAEDRQVVDILQAIMSLSRALRMRVTAEGVETARQAEFLTELGCDQVQGFYFGRPMPIDQVALAIIKDVQHLSPAVSARMPEARHAG